MVKKLLFNPCFSPFDCAGIGTALTLSAQGATALALVVAVACALISILMEKKL